MRPIATFVAIFFVLHVTYCHMPTVYEFCSHIVSQNTTYTTSSCNAEVCQGKPGKRGPTGKKGDAGPKGERGDPCDVSPCERRRALMEKKFTNFERIPKSIYCSLGIKTRDVQDHAITASSDGEMNRAYFGRLDSEPNDYSVGAWCTGHSANSWIQIDLEKSTLVSGIITQGRPYSDEYVTSFEVSCRSSVQSFTPVTENMKKKVFLGNTDGNTKIFNMFPTPLSCRYVRIYPKTWNKRICMRIDLINGNCHGRKTYNFQLLSSGYDDGNRCMLRVNGVEDNRSAYFRGHNIMVVNSRTLDKEFRTFDTYEKSEEVENMIAYLEEVPYGSLIAMAIKDATASHRMNDSDVTFMSSLGAGDETCPIRIAVRDAWALLTQKVSNTALLPEWKSCSHTLQFGGVAEVEANVTLERFLSLNHID